MSQFLNRFFPIQITKKIYFFTVLLVVIFGLISMVVTQWRFYRLEMSDNENHLYNVARLLDSRLNSYQYILERQGADKQPREEMIIALNRVLQPMIDEQQRVFPDMGMGYYSLDLDSLVAFGPDINVFGITPLPHDRYYWEMYKTGKPVLGKMNIQGLWHGNNILGLDYPIFRQGKIIGHIFTGIKLADIQENVLRQIYESIFINLVLMLILLGACWIFFSKLRLALEQFSANVLHGCPAPDETDETGGLLSEINPVLRLINRHSKELNVLNVKLSEEIEQRRTAEEELFRKSLILENFFRYTTSPIAILDRNINFFCVNEAMAKLKKRDIADFSGQNYFEFSQLYDMKEIFQQTFEKKESYKTYSRPVVSPVNPENGASYWDLFLEPVMNADGEVEFIFLICNDVTERVKVEEELKKSNQRISNILDSITDAFYAIDHNWRIIYINKELARYRQKEPEEIIGKDVRDLFPNDMRDAAFRRAMEQKVPVHFESFSPTICRLAEIHVYPSHEGLSVYIRDITEKRKIEKEMAQLDRLNLVGQMAASIGHEVRNPMTTVRGFLQIFGKKEEFRQYADVIELMIDELDRANFIITEYLSLARNRKSDFREQNLNNIIKKLLPLVEADAVKADSYLKVELGDIGDLMLDDKELRQVILNLVRNGLEAMPSGGCIMIKTFANGEEVIMAVGDHGGGIEPDALEKIGTPFFTTKESGTGLGLATCYSIAARHNAKIDIDTGPEGTVFYLVFKKGKENGFIGDNDILEG